MKKIAFVLGLLGLTLGVASCNGNNISINNTNELSDIASVMEIDNGLKKDIEVSYKNMNQYGIFKWSINDETSKFEYKEDLFNFVGNHNGFRLYGNFGDKYILCEYDYGMASRNQLYGPGWFTPHGIDLYYNDTLLISTGACPFSGFLTKLYVYSNHEMEEIDATFYDVEGSNLRLCKVDIASILDISLEDALKIKETNEKYNEKYFKKFLNESDLETNDYREAYFRLYDSLPTKPIEPITNYNPPKTTGDGEDISSSGFFLTTNE